jgi:NADPH-dependent curcumin reductase
MRGTINHQFRLARRPVGMPKREDWSYTEEPVRELNDGEVLVKVQYISLDPAMRGWVADRKSYIAPVGIGDVMRAFAAGEVLESKNPKFAAGDSVTGLLGVQEYAIATEKGITKVDTNFAPLPMYLGALGMPGITAYFGLLETGKLKDGETVVVSAAAGAVGSVVGQIAKIKGCRVVGIAGGPAKCQYVVEELGFDAAIDYKAEDVVKALQRACPAGVDVYFDNVGGNILDAVLTQIRLGARIVICGGISQYNATGPVKGPANYLSLLVNRASMTGMMVLDYAPRWGEAVRSLAGWMQAGKLKSREQIEEGLQNFPEVLLKLFTGENFGKLVLKLSGEK